MRVEAFQFGKKFVRLTEFCLWLSINSGYFGRDIRMIRGNLYKKYWLKLSKVLFRLANKDRLNEEMTRLNLQQMTAGKLI